MLKIENNYVHMDKIDYSLYRHKIKLYMSLSNVGSGMFKELKPDFAEVSWLTNQ